MRKYVGQSHRWIIKQSERATVLTARFPSFNEGGLKKKIEEKELHDIHIKNERGWDEKE